MRSGPGRLQARTAVVTGASQGIGYGIARALGREGADVAVVDVAPPDPSGGITAEITGFGRRALYLQADVSDEDQVQEMAEAVLAVFGYVDILVNNAGVFASSPVETMTAGEWDRVIAVNLRGTFLCTRAFLPSMLARGEGRIINIASQLGQLGQAGAAHYSASKGGVIAFTRAVAREVARRGVLVNAVAPGPVQTPGILAQTGAWKKRKLAEIPLGRFGSVEEVVPAVMLLASPEGSFFVGQTLGPNGGDVMF
jgi:NAD(P)-dependent dehydrogenase (short-subunit alcohol dehydrogenase family)